MASAKKVLTILLSDTVRKVENAKLDVKRANRLATNPRTQYWRRMVRRGLQYKKQNALMRDVTTAENRLRGLQSYATSVMEQLEGLNA